MNVAIFDLDKTLTKRDTFVPFLLGLMLRNPQSFFSTPKLLWNVLLYFTGVQSNSTLKEAFLVTILKNCTRTTVQVWVDKFVDQTIERNLSSDALKRLSHEKRKGRVVLASASIDLYVEPLARRLKVEHVVCSKLKHAKGEYLIGSLDGKNCYGEEKLSRVIAYLTSFKHDLFITAYSDHDSDLPLLKYANKGVAVNPNTALKNYCTEQKIRVEHWS